MIRSLELRDEEGLSSLWSLRDRQRACFVITRYLRDYDRSFAVEALRQLWSFDLKPNVKIDNLKNEAMLYAGRW